MGEPKPRFTPHDEVQNRILLVLARSKSGHLSAASALDKLRSRFDWTKADLYPWSGQQGDLNFGDRISHIRNHMVDMGLLAYTDVLTWRLTKEGSDLARQLLREDLHARLDGQRQSALERAQQDATATNAPVSDTPPPAAAQPRTAVRATQERLFHEPQIQESALPAQPTHKEFAPAPESSERGRSVLPAQLSPDSEFNRREQLWAALVASGGPKDVPRGLLRELGIYGNQAGIYVPSAETRTRETPKGIALSFLNTGRHYADELTATGVIYHYPVTRRSGHDESEVEASKAAYRAGLPVFVIGPGNKATKRSVYRGYIEDVDDNSKVLLITFTSAELPPPPSAETQVTPFSLMDSGPAPKYSARRNRPNQVRFAFDVFKRYGAGCAVCSVEVSGLVQAAHLLAKSKQGTDDARNGLPLCANHHLAFDRGYWCLDPDTRVHGRPEGPTPPELGIVRPDLTHLPHTPHTAALAAVWADWQKSR